MTNKFDIFPQVDDGENAKRVLKEFDNWRTIPEDKWSETRAAWHRRLREARYLDQKKAAVA